MALDMNVLKIEHDVNSVFNDAFDGRELVVAALNAESGDGGTLDARK